MLTCQMQDVVFRKAYIGPIVKDGHGMIVARVDALEDFFEFVPSLPAYEFDQGVLGLGGGVVVVHRHFGSSD